MPFSCDGVIAALWTPTDNTGRLLEKELEAHLHFLRRQGLVGLMVLGSTGEFPHLELAERCRLLQAVAARADSLPILANISDIRPNVAAELARLARSLGVAAVALLPPYFYPLAPDDLTEFFVRTAETAGLPLVLYNFVERTGNSITLEVVAAVADRVPLLAVKQSGGTFDFLRALADLGKKKNFFVLTGADTRLADAMACGAVGCVSGLANAVPELVVAVHQAVRQAQPEAGRAAAQRLDQLVPRIGRLCFPLDVAAAMEARGQEVGHPKALMSSATRQRYTQVVAELRALYQEWGLNAGH